MPTPTHASAIIRTAFAGCVVALVVGCARTPSVPIGLCDDVRYTVHDPAESVNRGIFAFNRSVDDYALAPVARGYRHLPGFFQAGVHNFVANFGEPKVFINDVLQGNGNRSVATLGRFIINSTVGIVGLIDVSGRMGIERHKSDFGQTFGVWNIANGPTVELPLLGTGNLRDATGKVLSFMVDPLGSNSDTVQTLGTLNTVGGIVDGRAVLLPVTDRLRTKPDYYVALRDMVASKRARLVSEGKAGAVNSAHSTCPGSERDDQ